MQPHEAYRLMGEALKWATGRRESVRFASWIVYHYWSEPFIDVPDMPLAWHIYQETHREWKLWHRKYSYNYSMT